MRPILLMLLVTIMVRSSSAQIAQGELRFSAVDPAGLEITGAAIELISQASHTRLALETDSQGRQAFRNLPFGAYALRVEHAGFSPLSRMIEVNSQIPREERVELALGTVASQLDVSSTLLDPHETGTGNYIGSEELATRPVSFPGRAVMDEVLSQPGWVQEGNGVIHPRGVDNGTQYLIDGFPITDVRSPVFAPELNINNFQSMNILTASFPAEYGRRLGGIIEIDTKRDLPLGWHGEVLGEGGSFDTGEGFMSISHSRGKTAFGLTGVFSSTDRYLDPPVEPNYTNHGQENGQTASLDHDFTDRDHLRVAFSRTRVQFLVPNELIQQEAGQRQDRQAGDVRGQISYSKIFTPSLLGDLRLMTRDVSAGLQSNPLANPISAAQDRGFRETYLKGALTGHYGRHEFKVGSEGIFSSIREKFSYAITEPDSFDPELPQAFLFRDRGQQREQSFFAQDTYRLQNLTANVGLRYDHYKLLVDEQAWSPRVGLAYFWKPSKIVFRGSYDRVFQPPPIQNLLLVSSRQAQSLTADTVGVPVPAARGNFWEAGLARVFLEKLRLDANWFRRDMRNWSDDGFLLNTGVSFPTSNYKAQIDGYEAKVSVPTWGPFSGYLSYSNQVGNGQFPLTGGLILQDASNVLTSRNRFDLSTVQRNTVNSRVRAQIGRHFWTAFGGWYGSGLPFEIEGGEPDPGNIAAQNGERVLDRLNLSRGHLRPSYSLDASGGVQFAISESSSMRIQADAFNLSNHFNLLNYAGLFSGTAIAPPRSYHVRLSYQF